MTLCLVAKSRARYLHMVFAAAARGILGAIVLCFAMTCAHADQLGPYETRFIVTGKDPARHGPAYEACFHQILAKVSGDPRLADDAAVGLPSDQVQTFVDHVTLKDRLWYRPLHDEQGSYDRPHDLTVSFKPELIDAYLAKLGRKPWLGERPALLVLVAVHRPKGDFLLTRESGKDLGMDEAMDSAGQRYGMTVNLPSEDQLGANRVTLATLASLDAATLERLEAATESQRMLIGSLTWSDADHGWNDSWQFDQNRRTDRWTTRGVNFDEAFRVGVRGAMQILSGNGQP